MLAPREMIVDVRKVTRRVMMVSVVTVFPKKMSLATMLKLSAKRSLEANSPSLRAEKLCWTSQNSSRKTNQIVKNFTGLVFHTTQLLEELLSGNGLTDPKLITLLLKG